MKTLAVLSALAAVAFSAPTLPEASHETHQTKPSNDVSSLATEKAASSVAFNNEALREIESTSPLQLDVSHEPSARLHLGLKKPIIIKKKLGLSHLYRSSGEEKAQADPQETCMQEVKVKLCDSTKTTTTHEAKSSIIEDADTHTMDNDVKQSIKMAKEAVENLQRDLLNMEHNPDAKMSQWKHSDSESDVQMHQEIEVARQALEQIQQNFGNLESMNLRAATLKDTEHLHDTPMKMSESEEARLVQWKEAIDNIQRNVEIAKNIEDSFKSVEHENALSDSKLPKKIDTLDKKSVLHETATISTQDNPASLHKHQEIHHNDSDMSVSASSPVEVKINPESREDPLIKKDIVATEKLEKSSATEKNDITDTKISNGKSTESDGDAAKKAKMTALRSADELDKLGDSETALKSSEKSENMIETEPTQTTLLTKSSSKFEKDLERMSAKKSSIEQEKSANAWKEPVEKKMLTKAAEQEKSTELDTTKFMKSVDQVEKEQKHDLNTTDDLTVMQKVQQFSIGKSVEPLKTIEHPDNQPTMKSADKVVEQSAQDKTLSHFIEPAKESSVKHEAMTMKAVKEAPLQLLGKSTDSDNGLEPSAHVQMKTSDFSIPPMGKSVHLDSSVSPSTDHHILHPDSSMAPNMQTEMKAANLHILPPSGKSVQLDNLQPQMENKAVEGKSAMESNNKMMQWKQMQGARGAYGLGGYGGGAGGAGSGLGGGYGANAGGMGMGASGLSGFGAANGGGHGGYGSGTASAGSNAMNMGASAGHAGDSDTGAVGVFPNAKVGGCAIPLLLSCSPSVVSGRLAKSHPSGYGAPAYRMGEDFKYHFKRDTKKTNEIPTIKVKRTNPKRVEKISLDKKL